MTKPLAVQVVIPNHFAKETFVFVALAAPVGRGTVALPPQMGLPPEAFQPPLQSRGQRNGMDSQPLKPRKTLQRRRNGARQLVVSKSPVGRVTEAAADDSAQGRRRSARSVEARASAE